MQDKRFHDPEFFSRYYTLYIPSHDITEETLSRFITLGQNRKQVLHEVVKHGKIVSLLKRLGEKELKQHYTIEDPYIFDAILKFWSENENYITSEIDVYIWHAYFNLAHIFKDPFKGAQYAIDALILHEHSGQSLKFTFNHFIILFIDNGQGDSEIRGHVQEQIRLKLPLMIEKFKTYLSRNWSSYLYRNIQNANTFLTDLFIYSFAKHCPDLYTKEISRYLEDYSFACYFLKSQLLSISSDNKKPYRIDLTKKDILLPSKLWDDFLKILETAPKGVWSDEDNIHVEYFLSSVKSEHVKK